jgi:hypothetical protein
LLLFFKKEALQEASMVRVFVVCLCFVMIATAGAHAAKPASPSMKRPVAQGTRGTHPAKIGGPAKRTGAIGGPAPHG